MASIFLRVPIVFSVFSQSTGYIRLEGNAGVLLQVATEDKNSSQVYRCTLADLVCLARETFDNAVKSIDCRCVCQPTVEFLNI